MRMSKKKRMRIGGPEEERHFFSNFLLSLFLHSLSSFTLFSHLSHSEGKKGTADVSEGERTRKRTTTLGLSFIFYSLQTEQSSLSKSSLSWIVATDLCQVSDLCHQF